MPSPQAGTDLTVWFFIILDLQRALLCAERGVVRLSEHRRISGPTSVRVVGLV